MIDNILLKKINSENADKIFSELYGKNEINAARQRYTTLLNNALQETGLFNTPLQTVNETAIQPPLCPSKEIRVFTAPGRTELAGNHTDHNRGKVLAASIQLDSIAFVQKRNDNIVFFRSKGFPDVKINLTDSSGAPDLQPKPEETETTEALIRGIAAEFTRRGFKVGGFSANAASTVLTGSGLSSSASIEVLLGRIFDSLYGDSKQGLSPLEIAQIGQYAENVYFKKPCGLMDQTACAAGGAVAIDFADTAFPIVKQIHFDPAAAGYALCVVNTGGSHADLTADYASIPAEMKAVAAYFGKSVLREIDKEMIISSAAEVRKALGDRALLRSLHFFDENTRVDLMSAALTEMEKATTDSVRQKTFNLYLDLITDSGNSSWELLQNIYSTHNPESQGISTALALTRNFFQKQKIKGASRVHGGGFAGTIQAYIPLDAMDLYCTYIESIFGTGSVTPIRIRQTGAVELFF